MRRGKKLKVRLLVVVIVVGFLVLFSSVFCNYKLYNICNDKNEIHSKYDIYKNRKIFFLNDVINISKDIVEENKYQVIVANGENIVYSDIIPIQINLDSSIDWKNVAIVINDCEYKIDNNSSKIEYYIDGEGKKELNILIYNDKTEVNKIEKIIYYVRPYRKQFLDEKSGNGTIVHYLNGTWEKYEKTSDLLIKLGIKNIRTTFSWNEIEYSSGKYDYDYYDKWIKKINENGINIIASFNRTSKYAGNDNIINNMEEINHFQVFAKNVINRYPFIKDYQLINEPNLNGYDNEDAIKWYASNLNTFYKNNIDKNIGFGAIATPETTNETASKYFFNEVLKQIENINIYSMNVYDGYNRNLQNEKFKRILSENKEILDKFGGFYYLYISEYGIHSTKDYVTEEEQAAKLVQQSSILDSYNPKKKIQYNFWNVGSNEYDSENNFGLITNDYLPKKSYYSMKNYYENTNGSEYIGYIELAENIEAYVYDKDGKPEIITWAIYKNNPVELNYDGFTAKDLYGKDIQPDENGKLTITISPVYLYDVDYNYFYRAISNVATSKYDEFKEKFATEISQISGFEEKINQRQNYSQSVANTQKLMQNTAITAMKSHYELGDIILKSYEEGQLKAESVKISSMLDMINDIGNSYEDLVTVSVNNTINSVMKTLDEANVDSSELTTTEQKIDETENLINTNTDVEIIYPTKILQFSKDCYEKADYINSLEEQNDIKAGLIISNKLHAQLLADWANKFASIQINNNINEYITKNPVTIEYSETNITNKSVKATIKTNAEIQITNNSNSKEYVFDQNGSFTFEYTIKGQAKQITAKVTNIDKTSPIINGVVDGKLYTSKITPTITDENLDTIKLILNGEEVKNFKSGTTLTEEGFYTLTATDKAGNKTQISFQIMESNNQNYIVQENIIKNISEQTKKSDFNNKLKLGLTYKITRNDEEINETDNIATGDILTTSAGDKYTLIVTGDLNKDGKLNLKDLVKMRKYFLDGNNLDENEMLAADCNFDGKINLKDLVKMRLMLLNQDATK